MAKLNVIMKRISEALFTEDLVKGIGKKAANTIRERTRKGFGLNRKNGRELKKLAPLTETTVRLREEKSLSSETSPGKSNLTESGDMLDDLTYRVEKTAAVVTFKSNEMADRAVHQERTDNKGFGGQRLKNKRKARHFMGLSRSEEKDLIEFANREIEKKLNKL